MGNSNQTLSFSRYWINNAVLLVLAVAVVKQDEFEKLNLDSHFVISVFFVLWVVYRLVKRDRFAKNESKKWSGFDTWFWGPFYLFAFMAILDFFF